MADTNTSPSSGSKRALVIAGSLVAALAVIYFSFFYPPKSTTDTEGTIGAVKKYHAEQITEKDVVLDAMASMNIETVNQAVQQTGTKLAESAREAMKAADEWKMSARTPENQKIADALKGIAQRAEALKGEALKGEALKGEALKGEALKGEALKTEARSYYEAAAIAADAKTWGAKIDAMAAVARSEEARKVGVNLKSVEEAATRFTDLSVRIDLLKWSDAARGIAMKAEQLRAEGKTTGWDNLAIEARNLAHKAEGLKEFARPEQVRNVVEGAKVFERTINAARADINGMRPEAMKAATDAARNMAGKAEELARPRINEGRDARAE